MLTVGPHRAADDRRRPRCRAGVLGSPVSHSLSPVLHGAAYAALGLSDWSYVRVEVDEAGFLAHLHGLDGTWRGLSLTMPLKEVAFQAARSVSPMARSVGSINTLVRDGAGWTAHNTDVFGIAEALRQAGVDRVHRAAVVGSGATARSALAALASLGASSVTFVVRDQVRERTEAYARDVGLGVEVAGLGAWPQADVVVGTVPSGAYAGSPASLPVRGRPGVVLDCVYGLEPSPLLAMAHDAGYAAVPGTEMLLHQAGEQVRLMTGHHPPIAAMRAALQDALARSGTPE